MPHSPRTMAPNRNTHSSRTGQIPGNFILNWQSSGSPGRGTSKPRVRRPITACAACRAAKVKCNGDGQQDCRQCATRGLVCTYTARQSSQTTASAQRGRHGAPCSPAKSDTAWPPMLQTGTEEIPAVLDINTSEQSPAAHVPGMRPDAVVSADWGDMDSFDWVSMGLDSNLNVSCEEETLLLLVNLIDL